MHIIKQIIFTALFTIHIAEAQNDGPFRIVKSFPISEPTWGAKSGDNYLVGAERAILVYRRSGSGILDYQLTNQMLSGLDGRIENGLIDGVLLYVGASKQGILAYRLNDLNRSNAIPVLRTAAERSIGYISQAGEFIYASYRDGGMGVFTKNTLEKLGEGLGAMPIFGFTAVAPGVIYASAITNYNEMLVVDAGDPQKIKIAQRISSAGHAYPTRCYWPGVVSGTTFYVAEYNGGVAAYDITNPLNPVLRYRFGATGRAISGRSNPGAVMKFALHGNTGFLIRDGAVETVSVSSSNMTKLSVLAPAAPLQTGMRQYESLWVSGDSLAIPTAIEGIRFYSLNVSASPLMELDIDLPSRIEGIAKKGRMVYVTADQDGVWQLNWANPGGTQMRRRIPLKGLSEDLVLYGNHLYVANGIGLGVIDVADENNPNTVGYWDFPYTSSPNINEGWVEGVALDRSILYVALGPAGMASFDLSNPKSPALLKTIKPGSWGNDVAVESTRKLLSYTGLEKFAIISITNPANPVVVCNIAVPQGKTTQGSAFSPDGNYLVIGQANLFSVFDIRNPAAPILLKSYPSTGGEEVLFYKGYLLVSGRGGGVAVWQIGSSPADLVKVQTLPCYYWNSKFWVEGDRVFTNSEGVDELRLTEDLPRLKTIRSVPGSMGLESSPVQVGRTYHLEERSLFNANAPWKPKTPAYMAAGMQIFIDLEPPSVGQQYYRLSEVE